MKTYVLSAEHTFAHFSYNHLGLSRQTLRFNRTSGTVRFDAEAEQASVEIEIDMGSIDTGSSVFDQHIQGPDHLDTARYPKATYRSTRVLFEHQQPARIEGELTIKGITHPVTLTLSHFFHGTHPMLGQDAIGANARTVIRRSEFGAGQYVPAISDEVTIEVSLEAIESGA